MRSHVANVHIDGVTVCSDRQTDVRRASSLNVPYPRGGGITVK